MTIDRIEETRLSAADEAAIAGLLARCFTTDFGGRSFFQQRHHVRLVQRDPGIVGHVAITFRAVRLGDRLVDIAGLAEVATDPARRGEGIAARLVAAGAEEARAARADFVLLFGTAGVYAGAGFRPARNPLVWADMTGARTGRIRRARKAALMVLPLGDTPWDDGAPVDLLGQMF